MKVIAKNGKAYHEYAIMETLEGGISLLGTEIKSLRQSGCNLKEAFVRISRKAEAFLHQLDIPVYKFGNRSNHEPTRTRKLLLHRREITMLHDALEKKQLSCIPLQIYLKEIMLNY